MLRQKLATDKINRERKQGLSMTRHAHFGGTLEERLPVSSLLIFFTDIDDRMAKNLSFIINRRKSRILRKLLKEGKKPSFHE